MYKRSKTKFYKQLKLQHYKYDKNRRPPDRLSAGLNEGMLPTWLPTPRLPSHRWGSEKYYHIGGKRQEIKKEQECQKKKNYVEPGWFPCAVK